MIMKTLCNLEGSVKSSVSKKYHKDSKQSCIGNPYTCQSIYVMNIYYVLYKSLQSAWHLLIHLKNFLVN